MATIYFLFSCHSQIANAAVTMHAAALIHNGISTVFAVTFHCKTSLNKCAIETSNRNIVTTITDGFIIGPFHLKITCNSIKISLPDK